jgi:hypothetical protein
LAGRSRWRPAKFLWNRHFWLCRQQQPDCRLSGIRDEDYPAAFVPWGFALRFSCRLISACSPVVYRGCGGVGSIPSREITKQFCHSRRAVRGASLRGENSPSLISLSSLLFATALLVPILILLGRRALLLLGVSDCGCEPVANVAPLHFLRRLKQPHKRLFLRAHEFRRAYPLRRAYAQMA